MKRFFSIRRICIMALFVTLQIVLSRYLSVQLSSSTRISLANVPIILSGLWLGPVSGAVVALISDVLGMLLQSSSGVYFPPMTLTPMLLALLAGFGKRYIPVKSSFWKVLLAIALAEILSSLYGSLALTWYYRLFVKQISFSDMLLLRLPWKLLVGTVESAVCCLLHRLLYERNISKHIAYEL